ncbi:hypothetical protein BK126_26200 [Paenibacillus sp. FSL H7-0326]|uniref:hypothetical protein n=1 Tax=Paenibacillus sp. FSL H7-0326 TaxID=1921144 RepID=UPI00096F3E02|nr:hypothetical protein [Paenibacillus sp. FSL H7-0326]OMC63688.1 hypothetical protein BK126_26200 [Paenibacillus sp. FSL H7-0326]
MSKIVWQLPVKQSNFTDHDWIHPKAKYHAFKNNASICGKYLQDTDYFETSIDETELMSEKIQYACNKCLKMLQKRD